MKKLLYMFVLAPLLMGVSDYDMSNYDVTVNSLTCSGAPCGTGGSGTGDNLSINGGAVADLDILDGAQISLDLDTAPTPDELVINIINDSIGPTQVDELEIALAADELREVRVADPAEVGSVSAGIQEAMDRCTGNGKCIVLLQCDTTYTLPDNATWGNEYAVETNGEDDIWFKGCGASSLVEITDDFGNNTAHIFSVETGSNNIKFSDFKIDVEETCASGCGTPNKAVISISGSASYVQVRDMIIYVTEGATSDTSINGWRNVWTQGDTSTSPDTHPRRVFIDGNDIQASSRAIELQFCDHCWVTDNYINFFGFPADSTTPGSSAGIVKYEGIGVVLAGNIINIKLDGYASNTFTNGLRCFWLIKDFGSTAVSAINESVLIDGNTCEGARLNTTMIGVDFSGYNGAIVSNNVFRAGQCSSTNTRSCYNDDDCSDLAETCTQSPVLGIYMVNDGVDNNGYNQRNIIEGNLFSGFNDNDTAAPIHLQTVTGTDPNQNSNNTIANNHFYLSDTADDGLGGSATLYGQNDIHDNYTAGGTTRCLDYNTSGTCVAFMDLSDNEFVAVIDGEDAGSGTTRSGESTIQVTRHDTDCTSLTDGKAGELCFEEDANDLYICEPTAGDCSGAEWINLTP